MIGTVQHSGTCHDTQARYNRFSTNTHMHMYSYTHAGTHAPVIVDDRPTHTHTPVIVADRPTHTPVIVSDRPTDTHTHL